MNEKPQEAHDDKQDLLEHIITQGLEKINASAQTKAVEGAGDETDSSPNPAGGEKPTPSAEKKNKRSSVYLYLLILFGAAFMMLLLAYFIQQRSNETTISDLRDSMNLSQEELLDQIRELEKQVSDLRSEAKDWEARYHQMQQESEQYQQVNANLSTLYYTATKQYISWENFWALEQSYRAGDYESCAAILLMLMHTQGGSLVYRHPTDSAQERYSEISRAVIDRGILDEDYDQHQENYQDLLDAYLLQHDLIIPVISSYVGRQEP